MIAKCVKCGKEYKLEHDEVPSHFRCDCGGKILDKTISPNTHDKPAKSSEKILGMSKKRLLIIIFGIVIVLSILVVFSGVFKDLVVTNVTAPSVGERGKEITVPNTIKNQGISSSGNFDIAFFLTPETNDKNRVFLGKILVKDLPAGGTIQKDTKLTIPKNTTPGNYYIRVYADSLKEISEFDEKNNVLYSSTKINIK